MSNNNRNSVVIMGKSYNINTTTKLDLSQNNLTSLPESIGRLTNLQELNLESNKLTSLPESIGRLTNLEFLYLIGNRLTSLPESIGRLTNLVSIQLRQNNLTSLPESIGRLTKLEMLELSQNNLTSLPESIGRLTNLKHLYLYDNNLTSLPDSIGKLTNLEELHLDYNKLTTLPESFGKLTKLERLCLKNNNLRSLPESFKNLRSDIEIEYNSKIYDRNKFIALFRPNKPKRVSKNTELFNRTISNIKKISNIPKNKRVYINTNSNVKNNGELRRLYNKNGINQYMNDRTVGRLHGGEFRMNNVKKLTNKNIVNKNVYFGNIKSRLMNSSLNNFNTTVERIKTNLPSNVNKSEVNKIVRKMKPQVLQKIFNKLKNSPSNNRVRLMNTMKNRGLMNQNDITLMKKKLLGSNANVIFNKNVSLNNVLKKRFENAKARGNYINLTKK